MQTTYPDIDAFIGDGMFTYAALRLAEQPLEDFALMPDLRILRVSSAQQ